MSSFLFVCAYYGDEEGQMIYDCSLSLSTTKVVYNGASQTPSVLVKDGDETLVLNQDYTVSYEDNRDCGVGRVIVKGKGNYSGYQVLKFGIVPKDAIKNMKVKSPHYMENTVTWSKVSGADGFYVYRKSGNGSFAFIANITDGNYQVFHDLSKSLKSNVNYTYKIVPYVKDSHYDEEDSGYSYHKPQNSADDFFGEGIDYLEYSDTTDYYKSYDNYYYNWYDYSCITGKCKYAYEADVCGVAAGKPTAKTSGTYSMVTGDSVTDYMAYLTNKKIIKKKMKSDDVKVKAIYNWMVKNCIFTKDVKDYSKLKKMKRYYNYTSSSFVKKADAYEAKLQKKIYKGEVLCYGTYWHDFDRAAVAFAYRKGSCSFLTPMFNILCNQAGVEAYIVDGDYVNMDKSRMYHNWTFAKIGKKYYWYDVPVACKNKKKKPKMWYKKGTRYWKTCHAWSSNATKGYKTAKFAK